MVQKNEAHNRIEIWLCIFVAIKKKYSFIKRMMLAKIVDKGHFFQFVKTMTENQCII